MFKRVAFLAVLCFSGVANAVPEFCFSPYIGADATLRHLGFKPGFGKGLFEQTVPQGNGYVGVQLMDYLALEGGYEIIRKKSKTVSLGVGDAGLGYIYEADVAAGEPATEQHTYKEELKGWNLSLLAILPCDSSLQFFGGVGLSRKKIRLTDTTISNSVDGFLPQSDVDRLRRTLVKRKTFLRLSVGIQKLLTDYVGVRAVVNWENTSKFGYIRSQERPSGSTIARLGNSLSSGVGVFVKF